MSFFAELKRRNVLRVAAAYIVASWLLLQVADVLVQVLELPGFIGKAIFLVLVIGFVPALIFSWVYELTPEGLKRDAEVDLEHSISRETAARLDKITLVMVALVIVIIVADRLVPEQAAPGPAAVIPAAEEDPLPSIAVLPFADLSPDQDQEYFADGISEELLNLLVRVDGLKVASRTSSFSYKDSALNLADIAAELQVKFMLEGSVRKDREQVRITAQLIDAATDRHLWSQTYDRELTSIFAIQDEIANSIVAALQAELGLAEDLPRITVQADTDNLDAYQLYLEGRGLFISRKDVGRAIQLLEQAVELDPGFARAWEDLGAAYTVAEGWGVAGEGFMEKGRSASQRALELNPSLSMAWAVLSQVVSEVDGDWVAAMEHYEQAIANDPLNATAWFWQGIDYSQLGFIDLAIRGIEKCIELEPAYWNCYRHGARIYLLAGEEDKALATYLVSLEQGVSTNDFWIVPLLVEHGMDHAAAFAMLTEAGGDANYPAAELLAAVKHPDHPHAATIARLDAWVKSSGTDPKWRSAEWEWLGAWERVGATVDSNRVWLDSYADFRHSPHFKRVVAELNLLPFWQEKGFPPQCRAVGADDFECD